MALIVSLDRGAIKLDLGDFDAVVLVGSEVQVVDGDRSKAIARHLHNRWMALEQRGEAYMTLNIAGPLVVRAGNQDARLGPYMSFSMTDGILYVEERVFGLWDSENRDWYVKDASVHCDRVHVCFHPTD